MPSRLDFTLKKYEDICVAINASGYTAVTLEEYLTGRGRQGKSVILRHDIDRKPSNALRTAAIEHKLGLVASYYFRANKEVFRPDIMRSIADMGHEIGYHYETLSETKGDPKKAADLFRENLVRFREVAEIKTACMHGAPLSPYDNRDMWKYADPKDFGLVGEAYLSIGEGMSYFSDTGRTWDMGPKIRDRMPSWKYAPARTTDDLVRLIGGGSMPCIYILTHPERWSATMLEWATYYAKDTAVNIGKKAITLVRS